jgi:hypothetical protein
VTAPGVARRGIERRGCTKYLKTTLLRAALGGLLLLIGQLLGGRLRLTIAVALNAGTYFFSTSWP